MSDLQFDRVVHESALSITQSASASCAVCHAAIPTEYYSVNGATVCFNCRNVLEAAGQTPRGAGPFLAAAALGLVAGIIGAAIYYGVIAIANLEIGIVAILIGYMVGWAVRKGAGGRGGRRFQVLAVALTYGAVALAYTPVVIQGAIEADKEKAKAGSALTTSGNTQSAPQPARADVDEPPSSRGLVVGLIFMLGFIAALPVIMVFSTLPSGLISAAIIFFGMRQAWAMTAAPTLQISGPYRIGSDPASTPA